MLSELNSSKIFENYLLKNGILEFEFEALVVSVFIFSSNDNKAHNPNMISTILRSSKLWEYLNDFAFEEHFLYKQR